MRSAVNSKKMKKEPSSILILVLILILTSSFLLLESKKTILVEYYHLNPDIDILNKKYRLVEFGYIFQRDPKIDSLTMKYGFKFENFGCYYTQRDKDYAVYYNSKIINFLEKRNGKNWYQEFMKQSRELNSNHSN